MLRDPAKVVDATKETRVDWDSEQAKGHLVRATPLVNDTKSPAFMHVQGVPLSAEAAQGRVVPQSVMEHVAATGRYPTKGTPNGRSTFAGGWPDFKKSGGESSTGSSS